MGSGTGGMVRHIRKVEGGSLVEIAEVVVAGGSAVGPVGVEVGFGVLEVGVVGFVVVVALMAFGRSSRSHWVGGGWRGRSLGERRLRFLLGEIGRVGRDECWIGFVEVGVEERC